MILILLLPSAYFFPDKFFQSIFQEHYQSVKRSVPDQDQRSVATDLGTNCLQRLSADNKSRRWQEKSEETLEIMNIKATKYKWKMWSPSRDDVKYKNNPKLKKECNFTFE